MRVHEILFEEFDIVPTRTQTPAGQPTGYNVVDKQTGSIKQTFTGPDAAGKAEEFRDAQNAKVATSTNDKAPQSDDKKTKSSYRDNVKKRFREQSTIKKILGRSAWGAVIELLLSAKEIGTFAVEYTATLEYNKCDRNSRGVKILEQEFRTGVARGVVAALTTAGASLAVARILSVMPMFGWVIGLSSLALGWYATKLAKDTGTVNKIAEYLSGFLFEALLAQGVCGTLLGREVKDSIEESAELKATGKDLAKDVLDMLKDAPKEIKQDAVKAIKKSKQAAS